MLDTAWADDQIGYLLRRASAVMAADYAGASGPGDLRPVLVTIMSTVADNPAATQSEIGEALGLHRANVVPLVADLVDRGLVERQRSGRDRRRIELHLSDAGRTELRRAQALIAEHEARVTGVLSVDERQELGDLLARLVAGAAERGTAPTRLRSG